MFTKKRNRGNRSFREGQLIHLPNLDNVVEAAILEDEFQRRILQGAAAVPWHNDGADSMADLEERLKKNVILMVVCNQDKINPVGHMLIGVAGDVAFVRIAQHRIEKNCDAGCLKQNASMSKISPAHPAAFISLIGRRSLVRQQGMQEMIGFIRQL